MTGDVKELQDQADEKEIKDLKLDLPVIPYVEREESVPNHIRTYVRSCYSLQHMRIAMGNRLVASFRTKLGIKPGESEKDISKQAKTIMGEIRKAYTNFAEGIMAFPKSSKHFIANGILTEFAELGLTELYFSLLRMEKANFKMLESLLEDEVIYNQFLKPIVGMGPAMAGILVSEINIHKAKYPSSVHCIAGLDVVRFTDPVTGEERCEARSNKKHHLVWREYLAADGTIKRKLSITYNPLLHNKLLGVLAPTLIKLGKRIDKETGVIEYLNKYARIYDDYKNRKRQVFEIKAQRGELPRKKNGEMRTEFKMKLHRMSIRYMIKMFLMDYYVAARHCEGLEVFVPYEVEYLGVAPHSLPCNTTPSKSVIQGPVPSPEEVALYQQARIIKLRLKAEKKDQRNVDKEANDLRKKEALAKAKIELKSTGGKSDRINVDYDPPGEVVDLESEDLDDILINDDDIM